MKTSSLSKPVSIEALDAARIEGERDWELGGQVNPYPTSSRLAHAWRDGFERAARRQLATVSKMKTRRLPGEVDGPRGSLRPSRQEVGEAAESP